MSDSPEPPEPEQARAPAIPSENAAPAAAPSGWAFWRPKLARALLVGGVMYAASRFAPTLPHTQTLEFRAPRGEQIVELELVLRDADGSEQSAAKLHPARPEAQLRHRTELPNGKYTVELSATLQGTDARADPPERRTLEIQREFRLEEHTVRVDLTP